MDIQLEKKKGIQKKHLPYIAGGSVIILLLAWVIFGNHAATMRVDSKSINIADVTYGEFNDYIRLNGRVQPISIVQISPEEGGIVMEKVVEEGAQVKKGDVILRLANSNLDLSILNAESELAEKQNLLRNTQVAMQQDKLTNETEKATLDIDTQRKQRTYKQMERLLPLLPTDTDKLYLGLSMYAGLRQGEIIALRWEDVDFDLGFIRVRLAIQYAAKNVGTIKPPKTDNGVRDIPMMGQLRAILEALRKDEGFIICGQRGADKGLPMTQQMVRNMDIRVNKFFAEHGIKEPFKSHRMRHTVLTLLNNSRLADDKSLQAWAGHRDAAFTRRQYMTPQEEQLQTVGNGFSEYISSLL